MNEGQLKAETRSQTLIDLIHIESVLHIIRWKFIQSISFLTFYKPRQCQPLMRMFKILEILRQKLSQINRLKTYLNSIEPFMNFVSMADVVQFAFKKLHFQAYYFERLTD